MTNSRQVPYRSSGVFASAFAKTASAAPGSSGRASETGGGGSYCCAHSTAQSVSRRNGGAPTSVSNTTHARPYTSHRPSTGFPEICSGAT